MRILGIDPGSQTTGFGIIECRNGKEQYIASGCIRIGKLPMLERLEKIFEGIIQIVGEYAPDMAAIEKIFVHKNVASALKLGQARGAAMVAIAKKGLTIAEYTPRQVKKTVVGYGGAEKAQIQYIVKTVLKLSDLPPVDAADALAVALCHGQIFRGRRT